RTMSEINDDSSKIDEKTKIALKEEAEKILEEFDENVDYMKKGWNRPEYIEAELPKLEKEILVEKDPLRKNLLEARKEYLERELNYSNVGKEFATGLVSGAATTVVITAAASVAPVTTTVAVIGGIAASTLNNKEEGKIEITSAQQTYLQNVTPEFYRTTKNLFVVNDKANKNNTEVLSMAKEFYSNAKTPDEKLSNEVGFGVGGALGNKAVNTLNSKYSSAELNKAYSKKNLEVVKGKFSNGKEYEVIKGIEGKITNTNELLTKEGQAKLKNMTVDEIHNLFKSEGLNVQKVAETKGTGIGEKFNILGNKKNGIGSIRSNLNGTHSSKYIVISTDKGNIKVIFDNPQNYISNLSNVEKASLIFIDDKLGR
ncbi:hypothetical protein, partial [Fusobacterium gastrosuis]|nr:hypothetical protein [Fusobacterium gastrosuis]